MAKLVDAADLKSAGHCDRAGSIPAPGTIIPGSGHQPCRPEVTIMSQVVKVFV